MQVTPHAIWRRSSHSGDGNNCVELAHLPAGVGMRDSKSLNGGALLLPRTAWNDLAGRMKAGEFDL